MNELERAAAIEAAKEFLAVDRHDDIEFSKKEEAFGALLVDAATFANAVVDLAARQNNLRMMLERAAAVFNQYAHEHHAKMKPISELMSAAQAHSQREINSRAFIREKTNRDLVHAIEACLRDDLL